MIFQIFCYFLSQFNVVLNIPGEKSFEICQEVLPVSGSLWESLSPDHPKVRKKYFNPLSQKVKIILEQSDCGYTVHHNRELSGYLSQIFTQLNLELGVKEEGKLILQLRRVCLL